MSTNIFNILTNDTYNEKMNTKNDLLRILAETGDGQLVPTTWEHVQLLVRNNLHKKVFHIGDELVCQRDNTDIVWQVADFDVDTPSDPQFTHSMTLVMKDLFAYDMQFDAREAAFYFPEGLSAGTYYFTIGAELWYINDVNKTFGFVLTKAIPAGGQLVFTHVAGTTIEGKTINFYGSNVSTTIIESPIIFVWNNEIMNGTFLGTILRTKTDIINSIDRIIYGNNNYKESAIRQWLNNNSSASNFWIPQNNFDRPPLWRSTANGFMYNMDNDFLNVIGTTIEKIARNTSCDGGGYDIIKDKFRLLSKPQIYGGTTVSGIDEGNAYRLFSNYSDLNIAGSKKDKNRIKKKTDTSPQWYWLRSPCADGHCVWGVYSTGQLTGDAAAITNGVVAACTIY